ncbi:MAG TPA: OmpA family protein [Chitinivibrionales bacterium]|nr:OmpA family protein [Chitinivibrionales bacterium]
MTFFTHKTMVIMATGAMLVAAVWPDRAVADTWTPMPATTSLGTRGLSQTASARALGAGRLNITLQGSWYQQKDFFPGAPNANANIVTGIGALAFGVSNYFDVFGGANFFDLSKYTVSSTKSGLGTMVGGMQASLPLPQGVPIFLGAQAMALGGVSKNQINTNYADGYNYLETRVHWDMLGKVMESLILGNESRGFELHLNEGADKSTDPSTDPLLLLSGGVVGHLIPYLSLAVEANSRTYLKKRSFTTDPVWITPSVLIRTPALLAFTIGCDISAAQKRKNDPAPQSLEPFRLFGNMMLSIDCLEGQRRAVAEKAKNDSMEHAQCLADVQRITMMRDNIRKKQRADSLECIRVGDSLKGASDALVRRIQSDSMALEAAKAEYNRLLAIEKDRRSDMEKKLLSTGMLILDAVYFESGRTEISMNSKPYLKIIGKMLERYPKLQLEVGGHTDNMGNAAKNQQLSQLRAEAVRNYLLMVAPSMSERLSAMGYGPSQPKADNRSAAGRKINRRVEIKVLNPEVLKEYN